MADDRLRDLERRVSMGDPEAEVAWLRERIRQGLLDPERLSLAAYLGAPVPPEALDSPPAAQPDDPREWLWSLLPWGRPVVIRAVIAAVRQVLPFFEEASTDTLPHEALELLEAWCGDPDSPTGDLEHAEAQVALLSESLEPVAAMVAQTVSFALRLPKLTRAGPKPFLQRVAIVQTLVLRLGVRWSDVQDAIGRELLE